MLGVAGDLVLVSGTPFALRAVGVGEWALIGHSVVRHTRMGSTGHCGGDVEVRLWLWWMDDAGWAGDSSY